MENTERRHVHGAGSGKVNQRDPRDCVGPECILDVRLSAPDHEHPDAVHDHSHAHGHSHAHELSRRRLTLVLSITAIFMVVELAGGLIANSLWRHERVPVRSPRVAE